MPRSPKPPPDPNKPISSQQSGEHIGDEPDYPDADTHVLTTDK